MNKHLALLLIDVQKGFHDPYWGRRNNPSYEEKTKELLEFARLQEWKIFLIKHCSTELLSPLRPDRPGCDFMDFIVPGPGEEIIEKQVNSAFIGTNLDQRLNELGIKKLIIAGLTTDHCVSTTTRMAANMGYEVVLISDALATFDKLDMDGEVVSAEELHRIHLASLQGEFAKLMTLNGLIHSYG